MQLIVRPDGDIQCVYSEELDPQSIGHAAISRGSHVEPTPDGQWTADLSPVNGPRLGPFPLRSEALDAERRWLEQHWLTRVSTL